MRLVTVIIAGLLAIVLIVVAAVALTMRFMAPAPQVAAVPQPVYVPCGDGKYVLAPAVCDPGSAADIVREEPVQQVAQSAPTNTPVPPTAPVVAMVQPTDPPPPTPTNTPVPPPTQVVVMVQPTSPPPPPGQHYPQCQDDMQSIEEVAARIGGSAANWTAPDWVTSTTQGAWVFRSRNPTHLSYPGTGFFDTPEGRYWQQDVDASEASYHCEQPPA